MDLQEKCTNLKQISMPKTTRILCTYHLFLVCREISYRELWDQLGIPKKTASRDISLLVQAGVMKVKYDRTIHAFLPLDFSLSPIKPQESKNQLKYLEKLRRCCMLMKGMRDMFHFPLGEDEWYDDWYPMSKTDFYRMVLPDVPDRTRQRDYSELEKAGYTICYVPPLPGCKEEMEKDWPNWMEIYPEWKKDLSFMADMYGGWRYTLPGYF